MIRSLRIRRFKCFEDLEIKNLSRVTLLGGANGVGKTCVLEALFLFFGRLTPDLLLREYQWRGIPSVLLNPDHLFAPAFHNYEMESDIRITAKIDGHTENLTLSFNPQFLPERVQVTVSGRRGKLRRIRTDETPLRGAALDIEHTRSGRKGKEVAHLVLQRDGLRIRMDTAATEERQVTFLATRGNVSPDYDAGRFGELDVRGETEEVVRFLRHFDPRVKDVSSVHVGDSPLLHADIGMARKIPVAYLGDGLARALSVFLAMATVKKGVVLIDEVGTGIHYSILPQFWREIATAAERFDCQVVATTHSYECIEAATKGLSGELFEPEFMFLRLEREGARVDAKEYPFHVLKAALDRGWEVR